MSELYQPGGRAGASPEARYILPSLKWSLVSA